MQLRTIEITEKKQELKSLEKVKVKTKLKEPLTFRVLPASLSQGILQPDFSLIPNKEFEKIKKQTTECKDDKRFSKEKLKSTYDHVILNHRHYAIQGLAGHGVYGKVEYAQDLEDPHKTFYVLKTQDYTAISQNEFKYLNFLKRSVGEMIHEFIPPPSESKHLKNSQHAILMKLAPGIALSEIIDNKTPLSTVQWLKIIISMLGELQFLHSNEILHLDVKPGNFIINLLEDNATLIDFGLSINTLQAINKEQQGSPAYLSPEVKVPDAAGMRHYSEKSDIYALGISIAQMLGLTDDLRIIDEKHPQFLSASQIRNPKIRLSILQFLQRMTQPIKELRPSLNDCLHFFTNIKQNLIETVGILDAKELLTSSNWVNMLEALKHMDKVILVDTHGYHEETHLLIKSILTDKNGIQLANKIFVEPGREFTDVAELVSDYMNQHEEGFQLYFGFSLQQPQDPSHTKTSNIHSIQVGQTTDYKAEIEWAYQNHPIAQVHRNFLNDKLIKELDRFHTEHKVESPEVTSRKGLLSHAIGLFSKPSTTYHEACLELERIAYKTRHTNSVKAFLAGNNIYQFDIKGRKVIEDIKAEFEEFGMTSRKSP
ncbi:MAG: protein kinase domain-containing protein [Gammaproteobacteria bacterium]